jgi:hypothetical protein
LFLQYCSNQMPDIIQNNEGDIITVVRLSCLTNVLLKSSYLSLQIYKKTLIKTICQKAVSDQLQAAGKTSLAADGSQLPQELHRINPVGKIRERGGLGRSKRNLPLPGGALNVVVTIERLQNGGLIIVKFIM